MPHSVLHKLFLSNLVEDHVKQIERNHKELSNNSTFSIRRLGKFYPFDLFKLQCGVDVRAL